METRPAVPTRARVLVVDDEPAIVDSLRLVLEHHGFEAAAAYNGTAAAAAARLWEPDILLTDVYMPGMDGVELAVSVSATLPGCRIVLFSGQATRKDLLQDSRMRRLPFHILAKPVHPDQLVACLRDLMHVDSAA